MLSNERVSHDSCNSSVVVVNSSAPPAYSSVPANQPPPGYQVYAPAPQGYGPVPQGYGPGAQGYPTENTDRDQLEAGRIKKNEKEP